MHGLSYINFVFIDAAINFEALSINLSSILKHTTSLVATTNTYLIQYTNPTMPRDYLDRSILPDLLSQQNQEWRSVAGQPLQFPSYAHQTRKFMAQRVPDPISSG